MKTFKLILAALMLAVMSSAIMAQSAASKGAASGVKTETLKVSGNCDMCKERIEKAAKVDGVSKAEWNTETKMLAVTYNPAKANMDQVAKAVAVSGHDNAKVKADDKSYSSLPSCCKYR